MMKQKLSHFDRFQKRAKRQNLLAVAFCFFALPFQLLAQVPAAPTGLSAVAASTTQVNLVWADASTNETGFQIERSTTSGSGFVLINTTVANATTFSNTGLTANTTYFYRVRATNGSGQSPFTAQVSVSTSTPAVPTGLSVVAASASQINLTWVDASTTETGFQIERSLTSGSGFALITTVASNATTFSNTGLTANTTYFYRIRAVNGSIASAFTAQASAATSVPATPTNPVATAASSTQVNLTWTDASNNETGFQVERSTTAGSGFVLITTTAANATSFANTGLTAGTQYFYRIRAVNAVGASSPTAEATATTSVPTIPTTLVATASSTTQINLSWVDASNNETGFQVERSTTSGAGFTLITTTAANATTFSNTGLTANTQYFYRIRAVNAVGVSNPTSEASASTSAPAAPTTMTAVASSTTQINLSWVDASTTETGFQIERSLTSGSGFSLIATAAANATSFSNTGLTANTVYFYRVRAVNGSIASAFTATATASTAAPATPTSLNASAASTTQINLTWVDASNNETGFQVERSTTSGSGYTLVTTTAANVTSFSNTGLTANTQYFYRIRAINAIGNSNNSPEITTRTSAPTIPNTLAAVPSSTTQINLTWVDASNNETGFQIERSTSSGSGFSLINTTAANATTFPNTGLAPGTRYFYRIRSTNGVGSSLNTAEASAVANLIAPTTLVATATSQTQINLSWTDASSNETGFQIERSLTTTTGFALIATTAANTTSFSNTGLTAGTQYFYRVRAINNSGSGVSSFTAETNATTLEIGNVPDIVEFNALKDLFTSTNGANWTNKTNWPTTWPATATAAQMGTWFGVSVVNGDVTTLSFQANNLVGAVPASLGNLKAVWFLDLGHNQLTGPVPASFSQLTEMNQMWLGANQFTGDIPNLSALAKLQQFDMSENVYLNPGPVPTWLNSPSITNFGLRSARRNGPFPSFSNAPNLFYIDLIGNELSGALPAFPPGTLPKLRYLFLNGNQLSGPIPPEIGNLNALESLILASNQFSGPLPSRIGDLVNLNSLQIQGNQLSGQLPASLGNLTKLNYLYAWSNQFTGYLPSELGNCQLMLQMGFENNQLTSLQNIAPIPALNHLGLSFNQLSGPIPAWIGNMSGLVSLYLHNNNFSGNLPTTIGNLANLRVFTFQHNQVTGTLPNPTNMVNLRHIDGSFNQMSGEIPASYSTNFNPDVLDIRYNQFSGTFPNISSWSNLRYLSISANQFSGTFPSVAGLSNLGFLEATGNKFTSVHPSVLNVNGYYVSFDNNELRSVDNLAQAIAGGTVPNPAIQSFFLSSNFLSFPDLIPMKNALGDKLIFSPQKPIDDITTATYTANGSLVITPRDGGPYSYVLWQKQQGTEWVNVNPINEDPTQRTYKRTSPNATDEGVYRWTMTNTIIGGMTLFSAPITVTKELGTVPDQLEFNALKDLFLSTNGANWTNKTNWPTTWPTTATAAQMGTWFGITVTNGDVTRVELPINNLVGTIPSSIGNLQKLTYFALHLNAGLTGPIPSALGTISTLEEIHLVQCNMTGALPSFLFDMPNLWNLGLQGNKLSGNIPSNIGNAQALRYISLDSNLLTGALPTSLWNLVNLEVLALDQNQLTGSIPPQIGNLVKMQALYLRNNQFTGPIPNELCNLTKLTVLHLNNNQFTGSVPSCLGSLADLRLLYLNNNQLSGGFAENLTNLTKLEYLSLEYNQLTGTLPASLSNMTSLRTLNLNANKFFGPIPENIGSISNLLYLLLSNNLFTGNIPASIGSLKALIFLNLENNLLDGSIPATLTNMPSLAAIYLFQNKLTGTIPAPLGVGMPLLTHLYLYDNKLTGPMPSTIASLPNLNYLYVYGNQLTSLPDFSTSPSPYKNSPYFVQATNNQLGFGSLEKAFANGGYNLSANPQSENSLTKQVTFALNGTLSIPAHDPGNYSIIVWEKQQTNGTWQNVNGQNQDATQKTFRRNAATAADEGTYRWRMTNSMVTDMTILSTSIQVNLGSNLTGPRPLYNGLITTARWRTDKAYGTAGNELSGMYLYDYDEKYQIKEAVFAEPNFGAGTFAMAGNKFRLGGMSYDPNGNIKTLQRYNAEGLRTNDFGYTYTPNTNKLENVTGYAAYEYNKIGQMTKADKVEAGANQYVDYDVTGKVVAVYKDANRSQIVTKYRYDDRGFRQAKETYKENGTAMALDFTTWYIRDASGNVLSIYESKDLPPTTNSWQYPLDGTMQDVSGNGMNGQVVGGATLASDRNGNLGALQLDGSTGYASVANTPQLDFGNKDFSVSIWVKKLQPTTGWSNPVAVSRWNVGSAPGSNSWSLSLCSGPSDNIPSFSVEIGQTYYTVSATTSLTIGQWYQLSASKAGNQLSISVNGILQGTTTIPGTNLTVNTTSLPLNVGRGEATGLSNAVFDDLQITVQLAPGTTGSPVQKEIPIYGSGKIGTYYPTPDGSTAQGGRDKGQMAYEITDHLGNVRAILKKQVTEYTATMEDDGTATYTNPRVRENAYFKNLFATEHRNPQMNRTPAGVVPSPEKSAYLYWVDGQAGITPQQKSVGPAIALKAEAGDQVDLSVYARFENKVSYTRAPIMNAIASSLAGGFAYTNGLEGLTQTLGKFNSGLLSVVPRGGDETGTPFAYLNYLVFNEQYVAVDGGAWRVPQTAGFNPGQEAQGYTEANNKVKFGNAITINQPGYIYVWVSNETEATKVWFDDLSVVHRKNIVSQATDYETWGGVLREQKYNEDEIYRYGYQGQYAERDDETGWNHFELREYDAMTGRWFQKDPMGQYFSPYLGMGNNPISGTDPDGGECKGCPDGKQYDQYKNTKQQFTFMDGVVVNGDGSGPTVSPKWSDSRFSGKLANGSFWSSGIDNSHIYKTQWGKDFDRFAGAGANLVSGFVALPVVASMSAELVTTSHLAATEVQLMSLEVSSYLYTTSELYATIATRRIAYAGFTTLLGLSKPGSFGMKAAIECHWFYKTGNINMLPLWQAGASYGFRKLIDGPGRFDGYYNPRLVYPKPKLDYKFKPSF